MLYEAAKRAALAQKKDHVEVVSDGGGDLGREKDAVVAECEAACYALNTAEYCAETIDQLQEIIRGKIDAHYADQVDLEPVADDFHDVIARAVKRLVASLEHALDPTLRAISSTNWGAFELVDEESPYVRKLAADVRTVVPAVRSLLSPLYFRNFCDKFVAAFLPSVFRAVAGAKRINEMGTHQLLLDLHSIKPTLLALPTVRGVDEDASAKEPPPPPKAYVKYVTKQTAKIEMLLKLVATRAAGSTPKGG